MSNEVRRAEKHKANGNTYFSRKDYDNAAREYSAAININPRNSVYYTNRALCYLKLKKYDNVVSDCETAIRLEDISVKGHYMLGQALTEKGEFESAIINLKKAYDLDVKDKFSFSKEIIQALLSARKKKWEQDERNRAQWDSEFLKYIKGLINAERDRQLQKVSLSPKGTVAATLSKFVNSHPPDVQERVDYINRIHNERLSQAEQIFAQSDENLKSRVVPDYFLDKISFNIMHDPVITPSGITYERAYLKEHFKKIGQFDPLSRCQVKENELYPNLALKEATEEFLSKNGWAADY
ncbi:781_t:CDS:1 [Acaulospora colombiana]|uniref:781_t:CDS:1 n=1 Tax=Acaulospora colombiana TaxID=27376 RepID=A0ACA9K0M5_9GLOM|nr:781_t:CDS:1 [Acaulospora colombiana]